MLVVEPSVELVSNQSYEDMLRVNELAIRNCYHSENNIKEGSAERLVRNMVKLGHGAMLEFADVVLHITTDRAVLAQMTRHRIASLAVESQRYCNYANGKFDHNVRFIKPVNLNKDNLDNWKVSCELAEKEYFNLIECGEKPETARSVLPNCVATSIYMKMNMRSLRNFLQLRLSSHAQKDIQLIARKIYDIVKEKYPVYVENLIVDGSEYYHGNMVGEERPNK